MAEIAGLALGVLGIAGLFKSCVENFDIVVRAREYSKEFERLCTIVSPTCDALMVVPLLIMVI